MVSLENDQSRGHVIDSPTRSWFVQWEQSAVLSTDDLTQKSKSFDVAARFIDGKQRTLTNPVGPNSQFEDLRKC